MLKWIATIIVTVLLLVMQVIATASGVKIENWKTEHGAQVYFVKTTALPMVDVRVMFAAGSAYDGDHYGVATLTNNMLGEGTKSKSADEIAEAFDAVGASFSSDTDQDRAMVSLRSLTDSRYLTPALEIFTDVLTQASFEDKAFKRVQQQTLAEISLSQESPDTVAANIFMHTLYGNQPYGHPVIGTKASVEQLTPALVKAFYDTHYVAENAMVVIVGDVSQSKADDIANKVTAALPEGKPATPLTMMKSDAEDKQLHDNFPSQQTMIMLGQLGTTRENSDYFPLVVGNSILGQLPMNSLLFKNVRNDRGLAYYADSSFDFLRYNGPFVISLKTRAEKSAESVDVVKNTLDKFVSDGPTAAQLKMAKDYINGSFPISFATNSAIVDVVSNIAFYKRPLNFLDTYLKQVNDVTEQQIQAAFAKIIHPQKMILVTVGPHEKS